jgi:hypothetical protein
MRNRVVGGRLRRDSAPKNSTGAREGRVVYCPSEYRDRRTVLLRF